MSTRTPHPVLTQVPSPHDRLPLKPPSRGPRKLSTALLLAGCGTALPGWACEGPAARLASKEGVVEVRPLDQSDWRPAAVDQALCAGDTLAVRRLGRAAIVLPNDVVLRLDQGSVLTLSAFAPDRPSELGLLQGALHVLTRFTKRFGVLTPYLNAMVDGTEFTVDVADGATRVSVTEGHVRAGNDSGEKRLGAGESAIAAVGQAPSALTLRPDDAVQWAMYFPQVVQPSARELQALSPAEFTASQLAADGRYAEAVAAWPDTSPAVLRHVRAGWLLGLGRVEEAQALLPPAGTTDADALALRAVIQVVRNQPAAALATAGQAERLAPRSAAPQLALSHARQAGRDLPGALAAARAAVEREGGQALTWARLAELQLASGRLREGENSAERALELHPRTPRARALLGFAQLLRGHLMPARDSLLQAQADFPADPLPHLGLGLADWRSGHPTEARREFEIAVMLDPGNAELRAGLARAYLAERRERLAVDQLDLARREDPASPTPWFIDGMRKQRAHRPVEAADDFERALALNDRRAVVRPNGLLDGDRAARTAALASVWRDLGFGESLLSAGRTALVDDPQNEAAHRLLADAYATSPRHESARVSELLQAQLRQSPRTEPVAPQELVPGLPVLNGPRALSLDETGAVYDESRGGGRVGLLGGNRGTWGTAALAWVGIGEGQLSVGHFHHDSDGFRPGAALRLDANNLLWQAALTPELTAQLEHRETRRSGGEIIQRLVPSTADTQTQRRFDLQADRLGLRHAPTPDREWLASAIWSRRDGTTSDVVPNGPALAHHSDHARQTGKLGEAMYSQRGTGWHGSVGLSGYREDRDATTVMEITGLPFPVPIAVSESSDKARHNVVFGYGSLNLGPHLVANAGLTRDTYVRGPIRVAETNPKLGLAWSPVPVLTLRAAAYETTKGSLLKEQSLEPTQFNGFNQVFDDLDGTHSRQVALGLDHRLTSGLSWGWESLLRRLDIDAVLLGPAFVGCTGPVCTFKAHEDQHRVHLNARLGTRWALSVSLGQESQQFKTPNNTFNMPDKLDTWQLPLRATYFSPAGWSAYTQVRGVRQTAHDTDPAKAGSARFTLLDLGLRCQPSPHRLSLLLDIANAFGRQFNFQNTYISGDPRIPLFQPGRTVTARLELRF